MSGGWYKNDVLYFPLPKRIFAPGRCKKIRGCTGMSASSHRSAARFSSMDDHADHLISPSASKTARAVRTVPWPYQARLSVYSGGRRVQIPSA